MHGLTKRRMDKNHIGGQESSRRIVYADYN